MALRWDVQLAQVAALRVCPGRNKVDSLLPGPSFENFRSGREIFRKSALVKKWQLAVPARVLLYEKNSFLSELLSRKLRPDDKYWCLRAGGTNTLFGHGVQP